MSILHIVPAQTGHTLDFMKIIRKAFTAEEHQFMTMISRIGVIKGCPQLLAIPDLITLDVNGHFKIIKKMLFIFKKLKKADHIIWHTFPSVTGIPLTFLFLFSFICNKSTWIVQGDDINSWPLPGGKFKKTLYNHFHKIIRKKISSLGVIFESDKKVLLNLSYVNKDIWHTPYPIKRNLIEKYNNLKRENPMKTRVNIQLGMSSQIFNHHIKYIKKLVKYKEEDIFIFLPMNYYYSGNTIRSGTKLYINSILKLKKNVLKNKLFVLKNEVTDEAYAKFLMQIQIAIFDNTTIIYPWIILDYLKAGKKVFLPSDTALYNYLKECGATIYPSDSIGNIDFNEFADLSEPIIFPHKLDLYYSEDYIINEWTKFFRSIKEKKLKKR
mgnify:CR=1 FL=1